MKSEAISALPVRIDGSIGEGGGQILRTSVALAVLTGRPVEIINIRARRSKPGLQAQHLTSVRAAAALCDATLHGAELGSSNLRLAPGSPTALRTFHFDVGEARHGGSAGAAALVAQTIALPLAVLSPPAASVSIEGGTHVPNAPTADYLEIVYLPALEKMGITFSVHCERSGFFPRGEGRLQLRVARGAPSIPIERTERGRLTQLRAIVTTSGLPAHVFERARTTLSSELKGYGVPVRVEQRALPGSGMGAAVLLAAECESGTSGWTSLGERGKPMERVCLEAVRRFQKWHATETATDEHLADQLVLPCALMSGLHRWTTPQVTEHLRTVLFVVERFLPVKSELEERPDGTGQVTLQGVSSTEGSGCG